MRSLIYEAVAKVHYPLTLALSHQVGEGKGEGALLRLLQLAHIIVL
jgi:hypothetical protein